MTLSQDPDASVECTPENPPFLNNNTDQYTQRKSTQELLKVTRDDLITKLRQLRIYETKYAHAKKEISKWKKKFDHVYRENELLSVENAKIDACHKQIAYLQQELSFKEEERQALRELVTALEQAHKKARNARKQQNLKKRSSSRASEGFDSVRKGKTNFVESVEGKTNLGESENKSGHVLVENIDDKVRLENELVTLKSENTYLLSSLDRKVVQLKLKEEQIEAQKRRIETLENLQSEQQSNSIETLKQKQEDVVSLRTRIQRYERQLKEHGVNISRESDTRSQSESENTTSESVTDDSYTGENVTPPGTPPPLSTSQWDLPDDVYTDQIVRTWEPIKNIRASTNATLEGDQLESFLSELPRESQEATRKLLTPILSDTGTEPTISPNELGEELQLVLRSISPLCQRKLQDLVIPVLKSKNQYRCTYSTMQRRALVTDARILLVKRDPTYLNSPTNSDILIGPNHPFMGPSHDDITKLVPHTKRVISSANRAVFCSEPLLSSHSNSETITESEGENAQTSTSTSLTHDNVTPIEDRYLKGQADRMKFLNVSKQFRGRTKQLMGTVVAKGKRVVVATAKSMQVYSTQDKYVHEGSCCQFCLVNPICGPRYVCATCHNVEMCETCYGLGFHGLENSDALFERAQDIIIGRCPKLTNEIGFLELLRYELCRNNFRKFQFCIHWITDILNGKSSKELQARALEVPNIRRDVRKQFVPELMRLVSNREDLEVKTEWELENDNAASIKSIRGSGSVCEGDGNFIETLRIWVADQYRTTSPFVERSISKYREGYEGYGVREDLIGGLGVDPRQSDEMKVDVSQMEQVCAADSQSEKRVESQSEVSDVEQQVTHVKVERKEADVIE